ncbi:MAG: hypothetical protein L3J96_00685 [Thermoplasmata archaeon]|nr:hypothetical protein [Thermoplasmata archaeon]
MASVKKGDEWWRLEKVLTDHRNAAVWLGVAVLLVVLAIFSRCEVLPATPWWGPSASCPTVQVGADASVAIGTLSLAYSAFVTAAQADLESTRAREAIIRLWARDSTETAPFVPTGTQQRIVLTGIDGLNSVFVDNVGPGTAELVSCTVSWWCRSDSTAEPPRRDIALIRQPYLAKNEATLVRIPTGLQEAILRETEETAIKQVLVEVTAHGFGGVPCPRAWLTLVRHNATTTPSSREIGGPPARRWEWLAENGGHDNEPPLYP